MAQRIAYLPEIGEVILAKRRGSRYIRLTITSSGKVRVGMPYWTPYSAGLSFAKSKSEWIQSQLAKQCSEFIEHGDLIGKSHRIYYDFKPSLQRTIIRVTNPKISISSPLALGDSKLQAKIYVACERALRVEAEKLLPQRLELLARRHGYSYEDVKIRKLTSRWGSCSNAKNIRLSYFLIQLPWPLIDYVLLHELIHTRHLNHKKDFWEALKSALPDARKLQKQIRGHNPHIIPIKGVD